MSEKKPKKKKAASFTLNGHSLEETQPGIWRKEPEGKMRVGVHLVGSRALLAKLEGDKSFDQAMGVATLPGVLDPVLAMPDIHQGYGFPIGGVAAFHAKTGILSPGGVGYDINCGVRMLATPFTRERLVKDRAIEPILDQLFRSVPAGAGHGGGYTPPGDEFDEALLDGARWAVKKGFGRERDWRFAEEGGRLDGADPGALSARARERGETQLGTLGSGNHFLEIQYVDEIYLEKEAEAFGLRKHAVVVTIHTGSRGLGYQVCADNLEASLDAGKKYAIEIPGRELACVPIESSEGKNYFRAMAAAANFAFANRQIITHRVRDAFERHLGPGDIDVVYDVCHNIAKFEEMPTRTGSQRVCIHRKGATRAFPPGHPSLPQAYRAVGQPVLVPGDMGRYSYVLAGHPESLERSFGSACHGAGRELSRSQAKKLGRGRRLGDELRASGIQVRSLSEQTLVEEMSEAYKDVADVIAATQTAKLAVPVARLRPLGVIKG